MKILKIINVEPIVFLLSFGDGILRLPVLDLVLSKTCLSGSYFFGEATYSAEICSNLTNYPKEQAIVQETVAKFNSVSEVIAGILTILVTIFLGSWCDNGGRKGLIYLTIVGRLSRVISLLFNYVYKDLVIEYFWVDCLHQLCGNNNSLFIGAFAIVTDETSMKVRTIRILIISGIFEVGLALSNLVTGYILEYGTFYASLATYFGFISVALLYSLFILRSSHKKNIKYSMKDIFSFKEFFSSVSTVFRKRDKGLRHVVILLIFTSYLCEFCNGVVVVNYYYITRKFSWPEITDNPSFPVTWLSQLNTIIDIPRILAVFFIVPFLTNMFQLHDTILAALAQISLIAGLLNYAFAANRNLLYINAVLWILTPNQNPAIRAILSKIVDTHEVGKV